MLPSLVVSVSGTGLRHRRSHLALLVGEAVHDCHSVFASTRALFFRVVGGGGGAVGVASSRLVQGSSALAHTPVCSLARPVSKVESINQPINQPTPASQPASIAMAPKNKSAAAAAAASTVDAASHKREQQHVGQRQPQQPGKQMRKLGPFPGTSPENGDAPIMMSSGVAFTPSAWQVSDVQFFFFKRHSKQ